MQGPTPSVIYALRVILSVHPSGYSDMGHEDSTEGVKNSFPVFQGLWLTFLSERFIYVADI